MAQRSDFSVSVAPQTCILWALLGLMIPLPWLVSWTIAAAVHELCHCLVIWVCGKRMERISIGIGGAEIQACLSGDAEILFCALAGPAGGLFLLLFADVFPKVALCAFIQSIFNLLPVFPLDGGRAFYAFMRILFSEDRAARICVFIEKLVIVSLCLLAVVAAVCWRLGMTPVILACIFLQRTQKIKIPCKWRSDRVQ